METTTTHLTWQAVCEDPNLRDLPFKIELDRQGRLIMSPTSIHHGRRQSHLCRLLWNLVGDDEEVVTECAIQTHDGTRVADVAVFSAERLALVADELDASIAPEICIEILSPGNTEAEMAKKRALYFAAGAEEVWICDMAGTMHFFNVDGKLPHSSRVPAFPKKLDV